MDTLGTVKRLERINSSIMSDVLDESGFPSQVLSHALRPLDPEAKLAGLALCVQARRVIRSTTPANTLSNHALERGIGSGMVAIVDAGGPGAGAMVGGFAAATLKAKGCTGLVVNGAVRDALEIRDMGLATYCVAVTPVRGSSRRELVGIDVPVVMPGMDGSGVVVRPGDLVLGDFDGIVIVPGEHAETLLAAAETVVEIEARIERDILAGVTREEALQRHPRFSHIQRLA